MPTKIIQFSDSHLSPVQGFFYENFEICTRNINEREPEWVINTGDTSVDGADRFEDLTFAKQCHDLLDRPVRFLPGNHDIGEIPGEDKGHATVTLDRLNRYKELFPEDFWVMRVEKWTLLGLNSQLIDTGLEEERRQLEFATDILTSADGPVGIYIHRPLWLVNPRTREPLTFSSPPTWRDRLIMLVKSFPPKFMATGHLHSYNTIESQQIQYFFCPSTAYQTTLTIQGWDKRLGFMEFSFDGDQYEAKPVFPSDLEQHDLVEVKGGNRKLKLKHVAPSPPAASWV